ncbi:MAG: class I SAM-dependent methyltransferase [Stellaceae bacterium]
MMDTNLPGLHRFQTAAAYYLAGRPAYAALLIRHVALLAGLDRSHRVMDLGCGPGQLAIAFTPFAGEIVAVDPEPAMLHVAAQEAARAKATVHFIEGSSADLGPAFGAFRLAVMGRSFHWMDRARTLDQFDRLIEADGAIALFGDGHPELPENDWQLPFRDIIRRYSADDEMWKARRSPDWLRNEPILLASAFPSLERVTVIERRQTPVERFVDRAFSMSITSPGRLGAEKAAELAREIGELMTSHATDGKVTEIVESAALIARRSMPPD